MIPLSITIKNFLSYGETQTIDFSKYNFICLSGKNGHGKSALLDAITWAVWGQARKIAGSPKADQNLLRIGQTFMMVSLDFEINKQTYRVRREYSIKNKKPSSILDFSLLSDKQIILTEKTIKSTQSKIEKIIGLDFETFSNSAFLRQDRANEFSKKNPRERKEILANILGLNKYEILKKMALEKVKELNFKLNEKIKAQERLEFELKKACDINTKLQNIEKKLIEIHQEIKSNQQKIQSITTKKNKLLEQKKERQLLQIQLNELEKDFSENNNSFFNTINQWRKIHKKKLKIGNHTQLEKDKNNLIKNIEKHRFNLQQKLEYKEKYLKEKSNEQRLHNKFIEENQKLISTQKLNLEKLKLSASNLEAQINNHLKQRNTAEGEQKNILKEIGLLNKKVKDRADSLSNLQEKNIILKNIEKIYQQIITQLQTMEKELDNLTKKKKITSSNLSAGCPLCEQNLSASRKKFLLKKFIQEHKILNEKYNNLNKKREYLEKKIDTLHMDIEKEKKAEEELKLYNLKLEDLTKNRIKQEELIKYIDKQITDLEIELKSISQQIKFKCEKLNQEEKLAKQKVLENIEYKNIKKNISELENKIKKIKYDPEKHNILNKRKEEIEKKLKEFEAIAKEISFQNQRKQIVSEKKAYLKKLKKKKKELYEEQKKFDQLKELELEYIKEENQISNNINLLINEKDLNLQEKGSLSSQKNKLIQFDKEYKNINHELSNIKENIKEYQEIALAMGKDGIQALLIEEAVPEVENEANALLSKLTDNQSQIFIDSLKDLKNGKVKETLDIKISDPIGLRSYELFSGGESFRIDLALRIAISKLLAKRAGTSLQTLIIDEGFGSQDEEGIKRIMEALYKIKDDFSKIIIVSHLTTMQNQFPVHFLVEKGIKGSKIKIILQN